MQPVTNSPIFFESVDEFQPTLLQEWTTNRQTNYR